MVGSAGHLSEEIVAELVTGKLEGESFESAERHIAGCSACMRLVEEAGRALATGEPDAPSLGEPPPLARGARVGRYEILRPVGVGGMGRVYAARDPVLDRVVALKLLHPKVASDELETRLLREAKAMARLSHPEVIAVHDAGRHGEQLFLAMELVEGSTLRQWLAKERRPWREVIRVFQAAARGLARAHEAGIIHRDFKPDNVLVGEDGRVRVTDFGLARTALAEPEASLTPSELGEAATLDQELTRTGMVLGTPAYMAPEQYEGAPVDARTDVYSFCLSLFEGLYGARPFRSATFVALREEKRAGKVRLPQDERGVPARVRRVVLTGLRPRPEDRHVTMDALLRDLERAVRPARVGTYAAAGAVGLGVVLATVSARQRAEHARSGDRAASAAMAPRGCESNRACIESHGGEPYVCRASDHACAKVASDDCTPMFEPRDLSADDTVWIGAMLPIKTADGRMNMHAVEMARSEIAQQTAALAGQEASLHVRRIAVVSCDDATDPMRVARHLVDDVGVPAIVGFGSGREVVDVAGGLLIGRGVLAMSTMSANPLVTKLPQPAGVPRMVWSSTSNSAAIAEATAAFVNEALEPRSHASRARVALVHLDAPSALPFNERFYGKLVLNGKPAAENADDYREVLFGRDATAETARAIAARVIDGRPSILVLHGDGSVTVPVVESVEASWPPGIKRPLYVLVDDKPSQLASFVGSSKDRRQRVFAVQQAAVPTKEAHFVLRFNLAHPGEASLGINPATTYDGFYLVALGVFASREVAGPRIAEALGRFAPPAPAIETGPADLFTALRALSEGKTVDPSGPSGSLDFDATTGELTKDFALLCSEVDTAGRVAGDVESGLVYATRASEVRGAMHCP